MCAGLCVDMRIDTCASSDSSVTLVIRFCADSSEHRNAYRHAYINAYRHVYRHIYIDMCKTRVCACMQTCVYTCVYTCVQTYVYTCTSGDSSVAIMMHLLACFKVCRLSEYACT